MVDIKFNTMNPTEYHNRRSFSHKDRTGRRLHRYVHRSYPCHHPVNTNRPLFSCHPVTPNRSPHVFTITSAINSPIIPHEARRLWRAIAGGRNRSAGDDTQTTLTDAGGRRHLHWRRSGVTRPLFGGVHAPCTRAVTGLNAASIRALERGAGRVTQTSLASAQLYIRAYTRAGIIGQDTGKRVGAVSYNYSVCPRMRLKLLLK